LISSIDACFFHILFVDSVNDSTCVFFYLQVSTQRRRWPSSCRFAVAHGLSLCSARDTEPPATGVALLHPPRVLPHRGGAATRRRGGVAAAAGLRRRSGGVAVARPGPGCGAAAAAPGGMRPQAGFSHL